MYISDRNSTSNAVTIYRPACSGTPGNRSPSSNGPLTNNPSGSIGKSRPGSPSSLQRTTPSPSGEGGWYLPPL